MRSQLRAWPGQADAVTSQFTHVVVCGEAGSHCVAETMRDLLEQWTCNCCQKPASDLVLLKDACSPVAGYEGEQDAFFDEMSERAKKDGNAKATLKLAEEIGAFINLKPEREE